MDEYDNYIDLLLEKGLSAKSDADLSADNKAARFAEAGEGGAV